MAIALTNTEISAGLPNVIIKLLASETPTITTDVGASKEYIDKKLYNRILIKPLDKNEQDNRIRKVLENEFRDWSRKISYYLSVQFCKSIHLDYSLPKFKNQIKLHQP